MIKAHPLFSISMPSHVEMKYIFGFLILSFFFVQPASAQVPDSLVVIFNYKAPENPGYKTDSTYKAGDVVVDRIIFLSTDSFKVSAYITHPVYFDKPYPLILFNHWGEGDKSEFLSEAVLFSNAGFLCVLPDEPWLCPDSPIRSFTKQGYEMIRQAVMNSRVAIDLATSHFNIDTSKIFCVGHSFGCAVASILSGIEHRIDYFIFMTGVYSTTQSVLNTAQQDYVDWRKGSPEQFNAWIKRVSPLDADRYLSQKVGPCLIQVAEKDEYITPEENDLFIRETRAPKEIKRYDSGHTLNEQAKEERMSWILKHLAE